MNGQAGTHSSMFAAYFPGEPYTITFEPTVEQSDAITRMVTARSTSDADGHTRSQYSFMDPRGHVRCRKCHAVSTADSRKRKQAELKEKAA